MEKEIITTKDLEEVIYEVTICNGSDKKGKIKIALAIDPDINRNYGNIAYFKVYHGESYGKSKYVARITFKEPVKYVIHNGSKPHKDLDKEQIDLLNNLLKNPSKDSDFLGYTVWQELICVFNNSVKPSDKLDINLPIPNYYNLL